MFGKQEVESDHAKDFGTEEEAREAYEDGGSSQGRREVRHGENKASTVVIVRGRDNYRGREGFVV